MGNDLNRLRGSRSRRMGAMFETGLDHIFSTMAQRGDAIITKTPEPLKVVGARAKNGMFPAIFTAKAQPDFTGTLMGGRSVMIEAKGTDGDRVTQDRVQPSQAAYLDAHARLGAICGIIVCLGFTSFGFVPWAAWKNLKDLCGHKYVNAEDLREHGWELDQLDLARSLTAKLNSQMLTIEELQNMIV